MVELPNGKMKSREGTVVDADDLINKMTETAKKLSATLGKNSVLPIEEQDAINFKIAIAALKYYILKVDPKKQMTYNPEESIDFNGNTGPFIQYTNARINSVLRKAKTAKIAYELRKLRERGAIKMLKNTHYSQLTEEGYVWIYYSLFNYFHFANPLLSKAYKNDLMAIVNNPSKTEQAYSMIDKAVKLITTELGLAA